MKDPLKKHDLKDLLQLYTESDECDKDTFAHFRSNVLLISGDHYTKKRSKFLNRVRESRDLPQDQKLRLTKNHTQKIVGIYSSNIVNLAPGVTVSPKNPSELQDQKAAELHHAVWRDAVDRYHIDDKIVDWADDFCGISEVACKVFWDPMAGDIKAYDQKMDASGDPVYLDKDGEETNDSGLDPLTGVSSNNPAPGRPQYTGAFVFEDIYGFNLLRAATAKKMEESPFLTIRKMADVEVLKSLAQGDEDKLSKIQSSRDETYVIFDIQSGYYNSSKDQVMLLETYFRPCPKYPKGYFFFYTKGVVLTDGELPGSIFPIVVQPFSKVPTSPRGQGVVKVIRPYQAEINRTASKMAEHQITLGDDKLLIQNGTKIMQGNTVPGVRSINYSGMAPTILAGRTGSQYLEYMNAQISEMYSAAGIEEDMMENQGPPDPMALLYRAASQKKRFSRPAKRFERFITQVCETYLELAKIHLPDDAVIKAVGRDEQINIPEFKNSEKLCYQVKLEPQSEDIETKMGRQMVMNQVLQYVGQKFEKEDLGKFIKAMPYANLDEMFDDMTIDYNAAKNDLLALDRGEQPPVGPYDDHVYMIKMLVNRIRKPDFQYLSPQIQENYKLKLQIHQGAQEQQEQALKAAEADYIPIGGAMIACDLYVNDPQDPNKTPRRARVPYQALDWLMQRLEQQGMSLEKLESMNQGAFVQMSQMGHAPPGNQPAGAPMEGPPPGHMGQANPGGMAYGNAGPGNGATGNAGNPAGYRG